MTKDVAGIRESNALRQNAPMTLSGLHAFREVTDTDGALPARVKALYLAVAALVKRYERLAARELARAKSIGLNVEEAQAGITILCSSRGEGAAEAFADLVAQVFGPDSTPETALDLYQPAEGEARDNFLAYFGEMPPSLGALVDHIPRAADAYYMMRQGTLAGTALGTKYAELLLVAVLAADYSPFVTVHAKGAVKAGASRNELYEAMICAVPVAGLSGWVSAHNSLDFEL